MRGIKKILRVFLFLVFIPFLYLLISYIFMLFPLKGSLNNSQKVEKVYILYDSMHTDILLNLATSRVDWNRFCPEVVKGRKEGYLAFGWGDKETYLNTPTWDDLKLSTALKALFLNTPSLLHVGYYRDIGYYQVKEIALTKKQFKALEEGLKREFSKEPHYEAKGFGRDDAFYASKRVYSAINTCNTWSGDRLREANVCMSYWTPFSFNVVESLK